MTSVFGSWIINEFEDLGKRESVLGNKNFRVTRSAEINFFFTPWGNTQISIAYQQCRLITSAADMAQILHIVDMQIVHVSNKTNKGSLKNLSLLIRW